MEGFLSPEEAGEFLGGVPERTMRYFAREGLVPAYRVGRRLVFRPADLREFAERNPVKIETAAG